MGSSRIRYAEVLDYAVFESRNGKIEDFESGNLE